MRCLYCGKELALFKRLRGGEFCSDAHRHRYQEEYTQLALNRLLQANSTPEKEAAPVQAPEIKPAEPALPPSPALKRREKLGREEPSALPALTAPAPASNSRPFRTEENGTGMEETRVASAIPLGAVSQGPQQTPQQTAVLDLTPAPDFATLVAQASTVEEPAPAAMSSFLVEFPVAAGVEVAEIAGAATNLDPTPRLSVPRLQEFPRESRADVLEPAGPITLVVCTPADFQTPPRERGLELREFVRGVPQVEIHVRPAGKTGFEPSRETFEVHLDARPPAESPQLWQVPENQLPGLAYKDEILLGELARLDFAAIEWDGTASPNVEPPPPAKEIPPAIGNARLEPMRVEPVQLNPVPRESSRPEPLRFEPVHIDPVFMEQIAGTAEFHALKIEAAVRKTAAAVVVEPEPTVAGPEPVVTEPEPIAVEPESAIAQAVAPEIEPFASVPPLPPPPPPAPAIVTKPVPVTLHGLAPARGKPVQVFTSAFARSGEVQIPRETGLPLRPTMVFGPAPKLPEAPASVPPAVASSGPVTAEEKPAATKPNRSIPVPEKREPRSIEIKPRRSEVRILPVQVKEGAVPPQKEPGGRSEPAKPELVKPEPAKAEQPKEQAKPEPVKVERAKEASAAAAQPPKETPQPPKETSQKEKPAEKPRPASPSASPAAPPPAQSSAEVKPGSTVPADVKARMALPPEELELLGLPKLSYQNSENFWTRLPLLVRVGAIALVLAMAIGGVILTSRGSGAPKPVAPVSTEPQVVEAGTAIATTAGWVQDWFVDRVGAKQGRHVDVLRGSLTLRDYRLLFEGQIQQGALGWVFRANDKSFYVEKIQVVTPGLEPAVALVHFAVINGQEQPRTQIPLPLKVHLDTAYKVRMDIVGDRFTAWVQDQKADQWSDNRIDAGGVGLYYDSGDSAKLRDTLNVIPLKLK
ncbi:MAG TPA: hypothetical protein VGG72_33895 [Bryobacteraceae bacterium]